MMQLITNLQQGYSSVNYAFTGCCDSEFEVFLELQPGDADHEITEIDAHSTGVCNIQILEIGGIPVSTGYAPNVGTLVTPNFILTQGNRLSVKFKYCPCSSGTTPDLFTIEVYCSQHPLAPHYFNFNLYGLDPTTWTSAGQIIRETSDIAYSDCLNDCDAKKDIIHLHNPSSIPVWMQSGLSLTAGFNFWLDGNLIDITGFWMPPGDSVIQLSNPGCSVPAGSNFNIYFVMCSQSLPTVVVRHIQNYCTNCGLDCASVQVNTSHPNPKVTVCPNYNGNIASPNWNSVSTIGYISASTTYNTTNIKVENTSMMPGVLLNTFHIPSFYTFPPNFNTTDHVNIYWEFETGNILSGNQFDLYFDASNIGGASSVIISGLLPNTIYSGIIDIPSFIYVTLPSPILNNTGWFKIYASNFDPGDYIEVKTANIKFQQYQAQSLIPQTSLSCSNLQLYNTTAIGDYKEVEFNLYYQNGFQDNTEVYFNPFIFGRTANFADKYPSGQIDSPPATGYYYRAMATDIGAGQIGMTLIADVTQKNYNCTIELMDNYNFIIRFGFYIIEDTLDWISSAVLDNERKLIYSDVTAFSPYLTPTWSGNVFTANRLFGSLIYIFDINWPTGYDPNGRPNQWYNCYLDKKVYFAAGFWDRSAPGVGSYMFNPQWTFTRGATPVTGLSTIFKTEVTFEINTFDPVDNIIFWLFDTNNTTGGNDFFIDTDSSRALVGTITTAGQLDNHLYSPSQAPTNTVGTTYQAKVTIDNAINPNGNWHIGAICYSSTQNRVESFLRRSIPVSTTIDLADICCPMDVDVHWYDYTSDINDGCFTPTVQERIQNAMEINAGALQTCLENLGMPVGSSWLDYMTNAGLFIYIKEDNYPRVNKRIYFPYGVYTSDRNPAMPYNWINNNPEFTVIDNGTTLNTNWDGRVPWDKTQPYTGAALTSNMTQYFNRTAITQTQTNNYANALGITQSWGGKEVVFEYNFGFDISSFLPLVQPFVLTQTNVLKVYDFEPVSSPDTNYMLPLTIEGWNGTSYINLGSRPFCLDYYSHIKITSELTNGLTDGTFVCTFSYYPYTAVNLRENENPSAPYSIPQLNQIIEITGTPSSDYISGSAAVLLDTSMLQPGTYQFCAIRLNTI